MVSEAMANSEAPSIGGISSATLTKADFRLLVNELREQNLDTVRFATYRAACKLRFIQKKVNLHLVDIWNVIEAFRENGLNAVEWGAEVKVSRIELLLSTVFHNLNKRLPAAQHIDTDASIRLLLSFLLGAYDKEEMGRLRVFAVKVALATLCAGKLLDKLRYMFSQISDSSGIMEMQRFGDYLREVLALPTAVFEGPTFGFVDNSAAQAFEAGSRVTVNQFLDTLMADPCPACLMWLPLLHRMASVEHVFHPVVCDGCGKDAFTGFRYKCQRCHNYQLCQDCFWRGRVTGSHTNQHEMKEYSSYKSPTKQLEHSVGKSLRCAPGRATVPLPLFPDEPDRPLDLANVVPGTPSLVGEARGDFGPYHDALDASLPHNVAHLLLPGANAASLDDEHRLIARYAAKLAGRTSYPGAKRPDGGGYPEEAYNQRSLIANLEQRNREIMREIEDLRAAGAVGGSIISDGSAASGELDSLRHRKAELEHRMGGLQETRRELMGQLEGLMRVLRSDVAELALDVGPAELASQGGGALLREGSPGMSPATSLGGLGEPRLPFYRESATPVGNLFGEPLPGPGSVVGSGVRSLPRASGTPARLPSAAPSGKGLGTLQGDLLSAADSITNTMSSLVKELDGSELGAESSGRRGNVRAGSQPLSLAPQLGSSNGR